MKSPTRLNCSLLTGGNVSGAVVFAGIENFCSRCWWKFRHSLRRLQWHPRRNVVGWDADVCRCSLPYSKHAGIPLSGRDIFLNVAGGVEMSNRQPTSLWQRHIDLISDRPSLPRNTVIFGEVGLAAEARAYPSQQRLKEAAKLVEQVVMPPLKAKGLIFPA